MTAKTLPFIPQQAAESYITQMLRQLVHMAKERDVELAYFIEMAAVHSYDLDCGAAKANPLPMSEQTDAAFQAVAI